MSSKKQKTVVAGALGECVHVAGVINFLQLAEQAGWRTVFLGPAVPINQAIQAAETEKADLLAVSYRLTPETGERLLAQFAESADYLREGGVQFAFGGTPPVAAMGPRPMKISWHFSKVNPRRLLKKPIIPNPLLTASNGKLRTPFCGTISACPRWKPHTRGSKRLRTRKS